MKSRLGGAAMLAGALILTTVSSALAHEEREVGDYTFEVGMLEEPVLTRGDEPVEGLEESLQATVTFGGETRDLEISPRFGEPGAYQSVFFPTAAGPYSFHVTGEVEGQSIDETFTGGPDTFG